MYEYGFLLSFSKKIKYTYCAKIRGLLNILKHLLDLFWKKVKKKRIWNVCQTSVFHSWSEVLSEFVHWHYPRHRSSICLVSLEKYFYFLIFVIKMADNFINNKRNSCNDELVNNTKNSRRWTIRVCRSR